MSCVTGKKDGSTQRGLRRPFPPALWKKSAFADNTGIRRLEGTGPAAEQRRETFRVYPETSGRIAVDEHGTDLIKQLLFDTEMEFPHILGHVAFFRLVQSQFKRRAVSAAGTCFNTDRTFGLRPRNVLKSSITESDKVIMLFASLLNRPKIRP